MYCNQCEQTASGGCVVKGVCGKTGEAAALQDMLTYALQGLAACAREAQAQGWDTGDMDRHTSYALFATLTNVNFDSADLQGMINQTVVLRDRLLARLKEAGVVVNGPVLKVQPASTLDLLIQQGEAVGLATGRQADENIESLQEILLYAIRGVAAYAHHAAQLGQEDRKVYDFIYTAMTTLGRSDMAMEEWLGLVMECGRVNLLAMELLDRGNTRSFGHPVPTAVSLGHDKGHAILVSGHDLKDLQQLLEATAGKGINIYTHGEMLPAHGYPVLKQYPHLCGHYGTAWQNQKKEFKAFPGAILMTTNCIQEPAAEYKDRIFTTGPVGWPGVKHLDQGEFEELIAMAQSMPGFGETQQGATVMVGFAHQTVLGAAGQVLRAIDAGLLKHIFLVGGCDGSRGKRSYFTEFVEQTPPDTLVLTLGCGKFRFFDHDLGSIGGLPRLMDVGQCNDAYSAIQIASALAGALNCGVNDLPLSLVLSWYEQKAVSILLTLLYLGVKDIRLGPTLPAFVSPGVLNVLVENFGIKPVATPEEDLQAILG